MEKSGDLRAVKTISSGYVKPAGETPSHSIWLSNIDLLAYRKCYTPMIYLYKPNGDDSFFDVGKLKSSLAKALVPFYPFAGEYGHDEDGRLEIHCTGKGVLFVEAACEWTMEEWGDFTPGPLIKSLFFPQDIAAADPPCPLFVLQLTRFKCGGVCMGTAAHHIMGDGVSSLSFISAWVNITRGADPSTVMPPFLDRSLLKARSPSLVEFEHTEYDYCKGTDDDDSVPVPVRTKLFHLTKAQVSKLKAQGKGVSTFSAVSAHAWRSACKARKLSFDKPTRVFISVDIRRRLEPPLPANYFGNALLPMKLEAVVGEIASGTIDEIGGKFEEGKKKLYDRFFRSQIDFLETNGALGRIVTPPEDIGAVNWLNLPLYAANFGWGSPVFINRAVSQAAGMVYVMRNIGGEEGSVVVMVTLEEEYMPEYCRLFYDDLSC